MCDHEVERWKGGDEGVKDSLHDREVEESVGGREMEGVEGVDG